MSFIDILTSLFASPVDCQATEDSTVHSPTSAELEYGSMPACKIHIPYKDSPDSGNEELPNRISNARASRNNKCVANEHFDDDLQEYTQRKS